TSARRRSYASGLSSRSWSLNRKSPRVLACVGFSRINQSTCSSRIASSSGERAPARPTPPPAAPRPPAPPATPSPTAPLPAVPPTAMLTPTTTAATQVPFMPTGYHPAHPVGYPAGAMTRTPPLRRSRAAILPLAAVAALAAAGCERKVDPPTAEVELERQRESLMKRMDEIAAEHAAEQATDPAAVPAAPPAAHPPPRPRPPATPHAPPPARAP